jgi:hypothetical protein
MLVFQHVIHVGFQSHKFCICCNPSLGLATKARAYKATCQEGSPGVTFHAPDSVGGCEGMSLHTPK